MADGGTKQRGVAERQARVKMKQFIDRVVDEIEKSKPVAARPSKGQSTTTFSSGLRAKRRRTA